MGIQYGLKRRGVRLAILQVVCYPRFRIHLICRIFYFEPWFQTGGVIVLIHIEIKHPFTSRKGYLNSHIR